MITSAKTTYTDDDKRVTDLPADFARLPLSRSRIIEYIDEGLRRDKPFFAYLGFTAPHNPLHAPDAEIAKYEGR